MRPSSVVLSLKPNQKKNNPVHLFTTSQSLNKERALQEEAMALNNEAKYKKSKDGDRFHTHF